jgi:hypothetical protein
MSIDRGNQCTRTESAPFATSSTINPTRPDMVSNPGRRGCKLGVAIIPGGNMRLGLRSMPSLATCVMQGSLKSATVEVMGS